MAEQPIGQNELSPAMPGLIYERMANVMRDIDAIVKKKQGSGVTYAFRSIEDVMNAIHPVLVEQQVFVVPIVDRVENRVLDRYDKKTNQVIGNSYQAIFESRYRFYTTDGSYVEASMCAESIDYSDKATQQASSYCYKNVILQTFCIPTKDLISDGDDKQPDRADERPAAKPPATQNKVAQAPSNAGQVLAETRLSDRPPLPSVAQNAVDSIPDQMTEEQWKAVKGQLEPFNLTDNAWYTWTIATLRANNLVVPENLAKLSVNAGRILYQVAAASAKAQSLMHTLPPPEAPAAPPAAPPTPPAAPAAPPAPPEPAPSAMPTHTGPPAGDDFS